MSKQIQIIPSQEEDVWGKSALGLAQGLIAGQELKRQRKRTALEDAKFQAEIAELERKTQALDQPAPMGYTRDPYSGKLVTDYSAFNGQGAQPQAIGPVGSSSSPFVMLPGKGPTSNPNYLNPLEQAKMDALKVKEEEARQIQANKEDALRTSAEENLRTIGEVKKGSKYFGMFGNIPSKFDVPTLVKGEYSQRRNWESNIQKLLSQKVLDVMSAMKQQSKTGATGFGALNKDELQKLSDASTALNRELSEEDAMRYLNDIETIHRKALGQSIETTSGTGFRKTYTGLPPQRRQVNLPGQEKLVTGSDGRTYRVIGGDPNDPDVELVQ